MQSLWLCNPLIVFTIFFFVKICIFLYCQTIFFLCLIFSQNLCCDESFICRHFFSDNFFSTLFFVVKKDVKRIYFGDKNFLSYNFFAIFSAKFSSLYFFFFFLHFFCCQICFSARPLTVVSPSPIDQIWTDFEEKKFQRKELFFG